MTASVPRVERRRRAGEGPGGGRVSDVTLNLIVLKTHQLGRVEEFYSALGLSFVEEKHGDGPHHLSARAGGLVMELYPLPADAGPADATTRLGFAVPDLDAVLAGLGAAVVSGPRSTEWGRRAVVRDPDGRRVEVAQG